MIKLTVRIAKEGEPDHKIVILGLSDLNVQRLTGGQPVFVRGEELKVDHDVVILHGATEVEIVKQLKAMGLVPEGAQPQSPIES